MGHAIPMIRASKALEDRGHEVHFISLKYHQEKIENMIKQNDCNFPSYFVCDMSRSDFFKDPNAPRDSVGTSPGATDPKLIEDTYQLL